MAIDPGISLGIRPPQIAPLQIQTPLDRYQKMLTLRHLMTQGQLGEQRLQAGAIELEDKQRELRDQEVLRSAYMQSGGDLDIFEQLASKGGASPKSIIGIRSDRLKLQLELANIKDKELPGRKYRNEQLSGLVQSGLQLPPDQYSQQWPTLRAAALSIDPKLELPLNPIPQAQLQLYGLGFATEDGLIKRLEETRKQAAEKRAVAVHEAELPEKQAKSLREELATAGQTVPDNQAEWDMWRAGFSKRAQGFIPPMFSPAALQAVQKIALPIKAATPGVDVEFSPPVFEQKKTLAQLSAPPALLPSDVENQRIRMAQAAQEGPKAVRAEVRAQAIGTQWQQSSKLLERYRVSAANYDSLKRMLAGGGPQDMALIYSYAKAIDENSVVKESEKDAYIAAGNPFLGALARFNGKFDPRGGFLSPQVKKDFLNVLTSRMEANRKQVMSEHGEIKRQQEVISPGSSEALFDPTVLDPEDFKAKDLKGTSTDDLLRKLLEKRK